VSHRFDELTWEKLRQRRSAKWHKYPADVLPSWVAEMDFPLDEAVKATLREAVDQDDTGYASFEGFGEAVAQFAAERLKWTVDPAAVSALPDVMAGVAECLRLLTRSGDGVVVNTPVYPPFFTTIADLGRRVVEAPLVNTGADYTLDLAALERAFRGGARAYLLCSPHNPTGVVFTPAELTEVARLARRYDVAVVADEIHAPLALPGVQFTAYLSLGPAAATRAVALTSASKAFNLAGLKCAALIVTDGATRAMTDRIPLEIRYRTGLFGVLAGITAFRSGGPWLDEVLGYLDGNRAALAGLLAERLPRVRYIPPQAGFLAWLDLSAYGLGDDPAATLLERGRVALTSGPDFGRPGAGFARLNIATSRALMTEAVARVASVVG